MVMLLAMMDALLAVNLSLDFTALST